MSQSTPRRGRPQKYGRAARAVTVTLPEDVLSRLAGVHRDIGSAIVRLAERLDAPRSAFSGHAEISRYGKRAVILVPPLKALSRLKGVQLVPIGDGRALISLESNGSVAAFELQVRDAMERPDVKGSDRDALSSLVTVLREARASRVVRVEDRSIIVLVSKRGPRVSRG